MKKILIVVFCILYAASPIDLIIDVVPILGWLDDVAVIGWSLHQLTEGGDGKSRKAA